MGILAENLVWLLSHAKVPGSMLELGNQYLYIQERPFPWYKDKFLNPTNTAPIAAKPFFVEYGFEHVSVDINGQDGALPLDLSQPITITDGTGQQRRYFDYITDFGTSEHVSNLWQCLANLHHHAHVGTVFFHVNPLTGNWPGHGFWYRDEEFYEAYAKLVGYRLLEMKRSFACGNSTDGWNIWARMEMVKDGLFPTVQDCDMLPVKRK
jgi:hypothetical protein